MFPSLVNPSHLLRMTWNSPYFTNWLQKACSRNELAMPLCPMPTCNVACDRNSSTRIRTRSSSWGFWTPATIAGCKTDSNIESCSHLSMTPPSCFRTMSLSSRALRLPRASFRNSETDFCQSKSEERASKEGASATKRSMSMLVEGSRNASPAETAGRNCGFLRPWRGDWASAGLGNANKPVLFRRTLRDELPLVLSAQLRLREDAPRRWWENTWLAIVALAILFRSVLHSTKPEWDRNQRKQVKSTFEFVGCFLPIWIWTLFQTNSHSNEDKTFTNLAHDGSSLKSCTIRIVFYTETIWVRTTTQPLSTRPWPVRMMTKACSTK